VSVSVNVGRPLSMCLCVKVGRLLSVCLCVSVGRLPSVCLVDICYKFLCFVDRCFQFLIFSGLLTFSSLKLIISHSFGSKFLTAARSNRD